MCYSDAVKTSHFRRGLLPVLFAALALAQAAEAQGLRPWSKNPFYWEYKGAPVLLLGGSDDDNLFQWLAEPLREHLDLIKSTGANYVRNTMSDRPDKDFEVYPFRRLASGKYDLREWNPEYWERFERFLRWTAEREIIVQIEIWDRFDYSRTNWTPHPYNPVNNVNYTYEQSGLAPEYPEHPGRNQQPFFFTTPGQRNNTVILQHQQRFVDKMLSYSLKHSHVLYCMDNETNGEEEWSRYWANYVKDRAKKAGTRVYVTEMWDEWDIKAPRHRQTFDHPDLYDFVDVSQNNHNTGDRHWENAVWMRQYLSAKPRPVNTVKTYGPYGKTTDRDGIERFWRHPIAGFASARFHRPPSGQGLNAMAQASIRAARKIESQVRFWDLTAANDLLHGRQPNQSYLAAGPKGSFVLYLTDGGSARIRAAAGQYEVRWVNITSGEWGPQARVRSDGGATVVAPGAGHWAAVLRKL
jgi:hypothetical protein